MPDSLDFSGLTPRQEWLLLYQGWRVGQKFPDGSPWPQPTPRTVKKLIERGLIEVVEVKKPGGRFTMTVTEYHVPLHIHMAFCCQCSEKEPTNV
ncbi:hypothetical protein CDEF62S_00374 [Castellaniella defragrans]